MSDKKEIEAVKVGQVYRDKDPRTTRYVLIDDDATKDGEAAMWCLPSTVSGRMLRHGRATRIKVANLQKRFELVRQV